MEIPKNHGLPMRISYIFSIVLFLLAQNSFGQSSGEKQLFTLEKSLNSENILVIVSQTDKNCKFIKTPSNDLFDFYWLMDGKSKKTVHPMIRSKVQERVQLLGVNSSQDSFKIRLNDLSEIKHDLEDNTLEVNAVLENGNCNIQSVIKLGASANHRKLNLTRTYCEVSKNMIGIPKGCSYLELQGTDADTGESLKVRYKGK